MDILIVGAGLGGLSAAVCFSKRGHKVRVLERRDVLAPQGGGLNIRPGASRILDSWGLAPALMAVSTDTPAVLLRSVATGDVMVRTVAVDASEHPDWGTTRQELMRVLYRAALDAGAEVRFGAAVAGFEEHEERDRVTVRMRDGTLVEAGLVLAADGIRSKLRPAILSDIPGSFEPSVSRSTFYGFELPFAQLKALPGTDRLMDQVSINSWMGQGGYAVTRYNPKTQRVGLLFGITSTAADGSDDKKELWDERGDIDFVRNFFKGSCSELETALRLASSCDRWKLAEMPDLPRWTSRGGRVALLGDSAHAMHPNAAQGYSQIVEDIGVLDLLLHQQTRQKRLRVPNATALWEQIRKPRVERIKEFAKWNTRAFSGEQPPGWKLRTEWSGKSLVKSLRDVVPDRDAGFHTSAFLKWALDYDAIVEARAQATQVKGKL